MKFPKKSALKNSEFIRKRIPMILTLMSNFWTNFAICLKNAKIAKSETIMFGKVFLRNMPNIMQRNPKERERNKNGEVSILRKRNADGGRVLNKTIYR